MLHIFRRNEDRSTTVNGIPVWHKCKTPFFRKRTVDGGWTGGMGQTWRRATANSWEYHQEPETIEDFEARQY